jgi:hypothetical protein
MPADSEQGELGAIPGRGRRYLGEAGPIPGRRVGDRDRLPAASGGPIPWTARRARTGGALAAGPGRGGRAHQDKRTAEAGLLATGTAGKTGSRWPDQRNQPSRSGREQRKLVDVGNKKRGQNRWKLRKMSVELQRKKNTATTAGKQWRRRP